MPVDLEIADDLDFSELFDAGPLAAETDEASLAWTERLPSSVVVSGPGDLVVSTEATIFDIETAPQSEEALQKLMPPFRPWVDLGDFNEATVKYGNTKDAAKRAEKLAEARGGWEATKIAAREKWESEKLAHEEEFVNKAALFPERGQVITIGYRTKDPRTGKPFYLIHGPGESEVDLLVDFWALFRDTVKRSGKLVGHNIKGFDLPFLIRRSWILDVAVPPEVLDKGRWWHPVFCDTMELWGCGTRGYVQLDDLCRYLGIEAKPKPFGGGDFYKVMQENPILACEYLLGDIEKPALISARMGIL